MIVALDFDQLWHFCTFYKEVGFYLEKDICHFTYFRHIKYTILFSIQSVLTFNTRLRSLKRRVKRETRRVKTIFPY